jgi:ribosomal protein L40E
MPTQSELLQKKLKEWYVKFGKTPLAIPVTVLLSCLVFYISVAFLGGACLANMLAPLFLLGMLWSVNVKSVKKILIIGAVAVFIFSFILCFYLVDSLQHVEPMTLLSEDEKTLSGSVSPWFGGPDTLFTYNLTFALNETAVVNSAHLLSYNLGSGGGHEVNLTMSFDTNYTVNNSGVVTCYYVYTYETQLSTPINQFVFDAEIDGAWQKAANFDDMGRPYYVQGPIFKDTMEVASPLVLSAIEYSYIYVYTPFAIIAAMIWWTRRARRMRKEQLDKWEKEHEKEDAAKPKVTSKVPSMASAMGKEEDTFVCSECGADVPADAEVCPKCGEKFD